MLTWSLMSGAMFDLGALKEAAMEIKATSPVRITLTNF